MADPIDFYFEFASPYGYLASTQIDRVAERYGRTVAWHPIMLGAAFRETGAKPLTQTPLSGSRTASKHRPRPRSSAACSARRSSSSTASPSGAPMAFLRSRLGWPAAAGEVPRAPLLRPRASSPAQPAPGGQRPS